MKLVYYKYLFIIVAIIASSYSYGLTVPADSLGTNKELTKRIRKADRYFDAGPLYYEKALEQYLTIHKDFEQSNIQAIN